MHLVFGATGNIGSAVIDALLARGESVRGVSRTGVSIDGRPIEMVAADMNDASSIAPALKGVDAIFILAGYDGLEPTVADAQEAGVQKVVLLSSSSVTGTRVDNAIARYNLRSEAALRESELAWTFLRPNGFMSNTLRWRDQLAAGDVVTDAFADYAVSMIDPLDLGELAAAAMTTRTWDYAALRATGPSALLPADRLQILGDELGRDLTFVGLSDEDARSVLLESMPTSLVDAFFQFFSERVVDETTVESTVQRVTGRPAGDFDSWVRRNRAAFL